MDVSDIDNANTDIGSEVSEVETSDTDFGDGDGVNDFDETYNEMNSGDEPLEYSDKSEKTDSSDFSENKSNETTDEMVDTELSDFEDADTTNDVNAQTENASNGEDVTNQSDMTTDESVDLALSDFDDGEVNEDVVETEATVDDETAEEADDTTDETPDATGMSEVDGTEDAAYEATEEPVDKNADETPDTTVMSEVDDTEDAADEAAEEPVDENADETPDTTVMSEVDDTEDAADEVAEEPVDETEAADADRAEDPARHEVADQEDDAADEAAEEPVDETEAADADRAEDAASDEAAEQEDYTSDELTEEPVDETETADADRAEDAASYEVAEQEDYTSDELTEEPVDENADETPDTTVMSEVDDTKDAADETAEEPIDEAGTSEAYETDDDAESDTDDLNEVKNGNYENSEAGAVDETDDSSDIKDEGIANDDNEGKEIPSVDNTEASVNNSGETNGEVTENAGGDASVENAASYNVENQTQTENTDTGNETENNGDNSEKTAIFENVSYNQGQNDVGALGTCGPTSIANSLNRVTGTSDYSENAVLHNAMDNNLCHKSDNPYSYGGTTTKDVVNIIDNVKDPESNIHTEVYEYDNVLSVDALADRLDDPGTVAMVGVDSATLWDQRGDVSNTGLFQHYDAPSDHWITVDSPARDETGYINGFNIIDSGGGVDFVDRDKFESMYQGDSGHTVSDPTAILISNNGDPTNSFSSTDGVERTSNYKGNAVESYGDDPPDKREIRTGVKNTECDINGDELSDEAKEINEKFRGDNFKANNSFESTFNDAERKELIDKNAATTCRLNENLDGKIDGTKYATIDKTSILETRERVPEIKPDTVMQKVIPSGQVDKYLNGKRTEVRNSCSKAEDTAPYISCGADAYKELRLDYKGNDTAGSNLRELEGNADLYVIRFTGDANPSEIGIPNDSHPCTGTGFTGSEDHLIPEYSYPETKPTDGAIYKIDADGNETMVGKWDRERERFYPVP